MTVDVDRQQRAAHFPGVLEHELHQLQAAGVNTVYMHRLVAQYGAVAAAKIYASDGSSAARAYRLAVMRAFVNWQSEPRPVQ